MYSLTACPTTDLILIHALLFEVRLPSPRAACVALGRLLGLHGGIGLDLLDLLREVVELEKLLAALAPFEAYILAPELPDDCVALVADVLVLRRDGASVGALVNQAAHDTVTRFEATLGTRVVDQIGVDLQGGERVRG